MKLSVSAWGTIRQEDNGTMTAMTHAELKDNLAFLSALQMLKRLVERSMMTEAEAESVQRELRKRLRPTV